MALWADLFQKHCIYEFNTIMQGKINFPLQTDMSIFTEILHELFFHFPLSKAAIIKVRQILYYSVVDYQVKGREYLLSSSKTQTFSIILL